MWTSACEAAACASMSSWIRPSLHGCSAWTYALCVSRSIFRYVALANWKRIAVPDDSSTATTMLVWKDRSLALNFLFGLRR